MLDIIIPVFNDAKGLKDTLSSLQDLESPYPFNVIVANDGGGNAISRIVEQFSANEVRLPGNVGSYAARNAAAFNGNSEILAFLDADQKVDIKWLSQGVSALAEADYAGGMVTVVPSNPKDAWQIRDKLRSFPVEECLRFRHFAPTANLFVKRQVFELIGGFNGNLRSSGDVDFGERVYLAGFRQTYCAMARTYHPARIKTQQLRKSRRIGYGITDKKIIANQWHPLLVATWGIGLLIKLPIETCFRIVSSVVLPPKDLSRFQSMVITLLDKRCKLVTIRTIIIHATKTFLQSVKPALGN